MKIILLLCSFCLLLVNLYATTHIVNQSGFAFTPNNITDVKVGDTVKFVWSSNSHTTTSTSVPNGASSWSGDLNAGSTTYLYKVTKAGTYSYKCNFHSSMTGSFIATDISTSVKEIAANDLNMKVYPNPANSFLNISFSSTMNDNGSIEVLNLLGLKVKEEVIAAKEGDNLYNISLDGLPASYYFVRVNLAHTGSKLLKVVKQ